MNDTVQGTDAWKQLRLGKVTASRIADLMAKTKTGWGASRANYCAQLVAERLTGNCEEGYTNMAMQWGIDTEAEARIAYEFYNDSTVEQVAFINHPTIVYSGASPDGCIRSDGLLEIKAPKTATHIETLLNKTIPQKYIYQMQWQLACTGRLWCDFASYDPRMPEELRLFVRRVDRDSNLIAELEREVIIFLGEVDDIEKALRNLKTEGLAK